MKRAERRSNDGGERGEVRRGKKRARERETNGKGEGNQRAKDREEDAAQKSPELALHQGASILSGSHSLEASSSPENHAFSTEVGFYMQKSRSAPCVDVIMRRRIAPSGVAAGQRIKVWCADNIIRYVSACKWTA